MALERTPTAWPCVLYLTASQHYLPGLAVALSSWAVQSGLGCGRVALLHHPTVEDSQLTPGAVRLLQCAAGGTSRVELLRVDDERMALFALLSRRNPEALPAFLKLEPLELLCLRSSLRRSGCLCSIFVDESLELFLFGKCRRIHPLQVFLVFLLLVEKGIYLS